jgi:serine/threonine protein kinase
LEKLSEVEHDNLIQCIAAIDKKDKYYFLFPWADGGSLRDFWENNPKPELSPGFVRDIIAQFDGMARALRKLHDFTGKQSAYRSPKNGDPEDTTPGGGIRHGDLKPENILRFGPRSETDTGTLKIADMGLAKHHPLNTRHRGKVTSTKYGTTRYEPPEVEHSLNKLPALSRLYDIWSMGCITLELLIWLLDGNKKLVEFDESLDPTKPGRPFYEIKETGGVKEAVVRDQVNEYIGRLEKDPRCAKETALGDLLDIVKNKLLVVSLPDDITDELANDSGTVIITAPTPSSQAKPGPNHCRVTAMALCNSLAAILDHVDDGYFYAARSILPHIAPSAGSDSETTSSRRGSCNLHPDAAYDIAKGPKDGPGLELLRVPARSPVTATHMRMNVSDSPS